MNRGAQQTVNVATSTIKWISIPLGQYIDEPKLAKLLEEKATANGLDLTEPDFEINVSMISAA